MTPGAGVLIISIMTILALCIYVINLPWPMMPDEAKLEHTIDIQNERIKQLESELNDTQARLTVCQSRAPSDATCARWLFHTDLSAARKRMCGR